ncbi:MAG: hypothetical protein AAF362_09320 [Pseudomonadota bacterium]
MMTLAHLIIAVSAFFLWRRNAEWGWITMMLVLVIGLYIFLQDVDFSSNLGVQL